MTWPIKWVPLSAVRFNSATFRDYAHDVGEPCTCMDCALRGNDPEFARKLPSDPTNLNLDHFDFTKRSHFRPRQRHDEDYEERRLTEFSPL